LSRSDYHDRLLKIGTGWLGWTERETLETSISTIELAYEGLVEKLRAIHGAPDPEPEKTEPLPAVEVLNVLRRAATVSPRKGIQ
jgi:hypothetical protein